MRRPLSILALVATFAVGAVACTPAPTTDWSQCPTAGTGQIQVAVVVTDAAPANQVVCVVVADGANGVDALNARAARIGTAAPVIDNSSGFGPAVCGIDGIANPGGNCFAPSYWGYWFGGGSWEGAPVGAGDRVLHQGAVDAWDFGSWDWVTTFPEAPTQPSSFAALTS